ncbi:MAG: family 78 glycoside hydrolase catalytic domain [Chitinophagaceae bacterium]
MTIINLQRPAVRALLLSLFLSITTFVINAQQPAQLINLRCDNANDPLGIDAPNPQFSWEYNTGARNFRQTAYQVLVADSPEKLLADEGNTWNSGKIISSQSSGIVYKGPALESRKKYFWKVITWSDKAEIRPAANAEFEMGLLHQSDWSGDWVGFPSGWIGKVHYFRRVFHFDKEVAKARAYMAGIGYYEMEINGKKVGDHVLDPATSDFSKRVYYTTYDIKPFLNKENVMVIAVAPGWYGMPKLRMQVEITFGDGTKEVINSTSVRNVTLGPVVSAGILDGEVYDARMEKPEWNLPSDTIIKGLPNQIWGVAPVVEKPGGIMTAAELEPIKVVESFKPISVKEVKPGVFVFDAGQNMAGWVRIRVKGSRGQRITLRFAETLYDNGTVNQENLRTAAATDTYIMKGGGAEEWEPRFTYHGFRYFQVEGLTSAPSIDDYTLRRVRSDVEPAGKFTCSNELLNRINQMVARTEASNLHSIPTDCPQRDERMGWMNDLTVRIEQAVYNFNLHRLYAKFIKDVGDTQEEDGGIKDTAPYKVGGVPADPVSASFLLLALKSYEYYGNTEIITQNYKKMKAWVDFLNSRSKNGIVEYSYYGDWSPPAEFGAKGAAYGALSVNTPGPLMSTGYYYYSASLLSKLAAIIGKTDDKVKYESMAATAMKAFNDKFWDEKVGGYGSNNQSCNSFAVFLGVVSKERLPRVIDNLVKNVEKYNYHLTTGNLCTKYLLEALTENGRGDIAYRIATQETYPSWGYMLSKGATTLWERWEYETGGSMNSHNHPMMGSVGSWLYKYILGILPDLSSPGFDKFIIHPYILTDLQFASGEYRSVKGLIRSSWKKSKGSLEMNITVPANSVATVFIPTKDVSSITEKKKKIKGDRNFRFLRMEGDAAVYEVGSGDYSFTSKW